MRVFRQNASRIIVAPPCVVISVDGLWRCGIKIWNIQYPTRNVQYPMVKTTAGTTYTCSVLFVTLRLCAGICLTGFSEDYGAAG